MNVLNERNIELLDKLYGIKPSGEKYGEHTLLAELDFIFDDRLTNVPNKYREVIANIHSVFATIGETVKELSAEMVVDTASNWSETYIMALSNNGYVITQRIGTPTLPALWAMYESNPDRTETPSRGLQAIINAGLNAMTNQYLRATTTDNNNN